MSAAQGAAQWLRVGQLIVAQRTKSGKTEPALDLSDFHFRFEIRTVEKSPNTAVIRVFNLGIEESAKIQKEFVRVVLSVGYQSKVGYGIIFDGTIVQTKRGKERNVDSYLDIMALDNDIYANFMFISKTFGPGTPQNNVMQAYNRALKPKGGQILYSEGDLVGGIMPRGKVVFGLMQDAFYNTFQTNAMSWAYEKGNIVTYPLTGYKPGEAVELNSASGLIGQPESTQGGIRAVCLINPRIQIGARIKINNRDINKNLINTIDPKTGNPLIKPNPYDNPFAGAFASVTEDGIYRVIVLEHEGDNRGVPWYSTITGLALDPSAPSNKSVSLFP